MSRFSINEIYHLKFLNSSAGISAQAHISHVSQMSESILGSWVLVPTQTSVYPTSVYSTLSSTKFELTVPSVATTGGIHACFPHFSFRHRCRILFRASRSLALTTSSNSRILIALFREKKMCLGGENVVESAFVGFRNLSSFTLGNTIG